jgi:hypothetical protein
MILRLGFLIRRPSTVKKKTKKNFIKPIAAILAAKLGHKQNFC